MTLAEFEESYYLHDSSVDKIFYDDTNKKLALTIDFCFWMQEWYNKGTPENGLIIVTFDNVSLFEYEQHDFNNMLENLDTEICTTEINEDGVLEIVIREYTSYQPLEMDFWLLKIKAEIVTVTDLKQRTDQID